MNSRKRNTVWHGMIVRDQVLSPDDAAILKTEGGTAAYLVQRNLVVDRIEPNSPAAQAGIKPGDVITKIGELRVGCSLDLERALVDAAAGDRLPVIYRHDGTDKQSDLVLQAVDVPSPSHIEIVWRKLGVRLNAVKGELAAKSSRPLHGGLLVTEVRADGVAGKAGIQKGDVLIGLHQWETVSLDNVVFVVTHRDLASFNPLCFYIVRSGQIHRGWFQQVE
jgi:serine protease Do